MRKGRFTEQQVAMALRQGEAGAPVDDDAPTSPNPHGLRSAESPDSDEGDLPMPPDPYGLKGRRARGGA